MQCFTPPTLQLNMDDPKNLTFNLQMANPGNATTAAAASAATTPTEQQASTVSTPTSSSSSSSSSPPSNNNNSTNAASSLLTNSTSAAASALTKPCSAPLGSVPSASIPTNSAASSSTCCDGGRMILADPLTGQTVCSCQYDPTTQQQQQQQQQLLNYQRLAATTHALPINMYGTVPYPSDPAYLPVGPGLTEQSAFYPPTDNFGTWPYPASMYYPYDPSFAYSYANGYVMDVNGVRQKPKNATRETTSTLKAWLNEHRKNPYPTKGEKIMLAIITRMTLTQVSTWFANARRRLKKENKMTWEPRNRVDDDDDHDEVANTATGQNHDKGSKSNDNGFDSNSSCPRSISVDQMSGLGPNLSGEVRRDEMGLALGPMSEGISQRDSLSSPTSSIMSDSRSSIQSPCLNESSEAGAVGAALYPVPHAMMHSQGHQQDGGGHHHHHQGGSMKPRIWSIVDTATSNNSNVTTTATVHNPMLNNNFMQGINVAGGMYSGSTPVSAAAAAAKASQQFVKNLRFGYASPYVKTPWTNDGGGGDVNNPSPSSSTSSTPSSSVSTPPCLPNQSINNNNNAFKSMIETSAPSSSAAAAAAAMLMVNKRPNMSGFNTSGVVTSSVNSLTTGSTTCTPTASYPMSSIAAAAAAAAYNTNTMNSALLGRAYAQTIQNLSNLTKGLLMTGATGSQLGGASSAAAHYMGSVKTSTQGPLQQDQRSEMQSSTS